MSGALTVEKLSEKVASQVKAGAVSEYILDCTQEAIDLVDVHIGAVQDIPQTARSRAIIETATELFWRRNAQNGIATFGNGESLETVRIGADPMRAARVILAPWLGPPIA